MNTLDWIIMLGTLLTIVTYGIWKTRHVKTSRSYLRGDDDLKWWTIGLSIMATQASAITFLSTPGQAYDDGMRFVQFYFGMPLAMVFLSVVVLPIYYRLKVYTAYEYLEGRFDRKTRTLTALLFLTQRGLAAGLTIYAPSIVLSAIMGWSLNWTIFLMGIFVIFYTVMGGTKAVSVTQKQQMIVILSGMLIAAVILVFKLPKDISFGNAVSLAGKMDKLNTVDFSFDWNNRYNFWTGMFASVFLFLSYFGTDQSQVQRYLSGKSLTESRIGLLFNGIFKVPMQFLILFVGILVFVFFQFNRPPVHFNNANVESLKNTESAARYYELEQQHAIVFDQQQAAVRQLLSAIDTGNEDAIGQTKLHIAGLREQDTRIREEVKTLIASQNPKAKTQDTDYVFLTFVINYLPVGIVGLLLAVIFSAAWSSTASELSALSTTTVVDIYRRSFVQDATDRHYLRASKGFTVLWGAIALSFAAIADLFENLIQAVNIIGSLFYGVILGIFFVAFFMKRIGGNAVFTAAILGEACVLGIFFYGNIAFLWLNFIGCAIVMILAFLLQAVMGPGNAQRKKLLTN
ncbi:MAG TPA: sodium:solute symporter [Saprospiraceae bacterium]|nr:sodium:solute symporter [Saprospiraceae bacterium]HMP22589.1 sodium:solute symporter [Saprospiraceae bacterium]